MATAIPPELTSPSVVLCLFLFPQDTSSRSFFDPTSQHRDWCPWVNSTLGEEARENSDSKADGSPAAEPGWRLVLHVLLAHKQANQPTETESTVSSACWPRAAGVEGL